ncbi:MULTISPECIES: serine hydrolase [unclassified Imperialibacter]|uniref:serine hydrolase domain-containing protein n=1 Tax=unclassified Imperialibacter TaxID=2629706 RepID=UPI00125C04D2|nr:MULTISPECIES: serine hydrolase domain-containing protein [unclassified Imperialibacter]CAD5254239.1 Serine hydrolase [Imperialibacter sp. 75]CAD5262681.1 Serine hydrolase [Imperialibacter sp. 89]VVT35294.1 Serine hydrolase [Imperialibacter sp. EC-SDR9]
MKKKQTKRILRIAFIVASFGSLYFVPWILVKAWIMPLPDSIQEQVSEAIDLGFDGMIVYVDQAGKPPELYAAGWHDRKDKIPANPKALFKIASVSKLYVAVAVAKLVNDKQLSLDKTLAEYIPEVVGRIEHADKITLKMMVQHRSGIPDFSRTAGYWVDPPKANRENLELVLDKPADFEPDESYGYSNTNYLLIGDILDKTLGYSHHQYIKTEILMPLRLNNTYSLLSEVNIDDVMSGYYVGYDGDLKHNEFISPAGSMIATAEDVGKFLRALNDGSVFKDGEQEIYSSIYVYEHTGLLPGYQSIAKYHKDIDTVIIQFNNTTNFDGYDWSLAEIINSRVEKIVRKKKADHNI